MAASEKRARVLGPPAKKMAEKAKYEPVPEEEKEGGDGQVLGEVAPINVPLSKLEKLVYEDAQRRKLDDQYRAKAEGVLWVVTTAFILWYGDGKKNFFDLVKTDKRISR